MKIGAGTRIWHHCHIRRGASIGEGCTLGKNVFVDESVEIGSSVKIQNNVSVYRGVELGEKVFVGPSVVFTNDRVPRAEAPDWEVIPTRIGPGASIGANATIVAGSHVEGWAMVGAGSVVVAPVPSHQIVVGNPARRIGWICRCGETIQRDASVGSLECSECGTTLDRLV